MFEAVMAELAGDEVDGLGRGELADRVEAGRRLLGAVTAWQARVVRAVDALDDDGLDGAGMLRTAGRMSSKAATAAASTAGGLALLPRTTEALAAGRITAEHAASVADAAAAVSPERADAELVRQAEAAPADVFAKRSREWVGRNQTDEEVAAAHEKARARRTARLWKSREGMHVLHAELDPITGKKVAAALTEAYDRAWRADGGRDGEPDEVRTGQQRLADVLADLLGGEAGGKGGHPKHQMTVMFDVSRMSDDPSGVAQLTDGTPLPQAVLEQMACNAEITGVIFDGPGQPIWVSRDYRTATVAQWKGLIARDRGCVGCGADPNRCEAHHIVAWRAGGPTDITNLVLVCSRCHHDLHDRGMELVATATGWTIRPRAGPEALTLAA